MALTSRIKVKNRIFQGGSRYRRERNRTHFTFARSSIGLVNPMRYASSGVLFSGAGIGAVKKTTKRASTGTILGLFRVVVSSDR